MIPRHEWLENKESSKPLIWLRPIPDQVLISETSTAPCNTSEDCAQWMRTNRDYSMKNGCGDIPHNFYIGGNGAVYTGYGWRAVGEHAGNFSNKSIGISFIGSFGTEAPTNNQFEALQNLLEVGLYHEGITNNYTIHVQRQPIQMAIKNADNQLYDILQGWSRIGNDVTVFSQCQKFV